jgi:hypothetical protein
VKKLRILLDMDCVMADFIRPAAALFGLSWEEVEPFWPRGRFLLLQNLIPQALAAKTGAPVEWAEATFWKAIEGREGFWAQLPEFEWTRQLLGIVQLNTADWYVASAPSRCPRCISEKREWLHRLLDVDWFDRLIPTPHKELMAKPGVVLIDDNPDNCERFRAEGGDAVLFPAHHNVNHGRADSPLGYVAAQLRRLQSFS